jgi:Rieske Fe-S protein
MARCETCGNEYDKAFKITAAGESHIFDSFECAIQAMAPECAHCGCKVIGHGVESKGVFYCCAHCANQEGVREVADRSEKPAQSSM